MNIFEKDVTRGLKQERQRKEEGVVLVWGVII